MMLADLTLIITLYEYINTLSYIKPILRDDIQGLIERLGEFTASDYVFIDLVLMV